MKYLFITIGLAIFMGFIQARKASPYLFPTLPFFPKMPSSLNNPVTEEGVELGRFLFYDPILSEDSSLACASCHKQVNAFADQGVTFSKGKNGLLTTRNAQPLFNLAWYPAFFWDGRSESIENQIFHPLRNPDEMNFSWLEAAKRIEKSHFYRIKFEAAFGQITIDSTLISKAIAQFLRTLLSYQSKYDKVMIGKARFTDDEYQGFVLMNDMTKGDCLHCHTTDANALGTTLSFSNNGLDSVQNAALYKDKGLGGFTKKTQDLGKFKIPSVRNVAFTPPYMHDGRFQTLAEVLNFYNEGVHKSANIDSKMGTAQTGGAHLSETEKCQIIAFLLTLSDSTFVKDTRFANPF